MLAILTFNNFEMKKQNCDKKELTCRQEPKRCVKDVVCVESGTRHGWSNDDLQFVSGI
jgi:hypothetical protein